MNRLTGAVGAAVLVLALHAPAQGLELRVGATANYGTTNEFGVGPRLELGFAPYLPGLRLVWDYHQYFNSTVYNDVDGLVVESSAWDAGFQVVYDIVTFPVGQGVTLYAGAGGMYASRDYDHWLKRSDEDISDADLRNRYDKLQTLENKYQDDSGASFALTLGTTFATGWTVLPFLEARYTFGVVDEFMLAGGILFSTGTGAE